MASAVTALRSATRSRRGLLWAPLVLVALYIAVPFLAMVGFVLFPGGNLDFSAFSSLGSDGRLGPALTRTLVVTVLAVVVLLVVLVPAVVAVHLWAPRLRGALEVLCTLPLVVPPIALAAGILALLRWAAQQGRGSFPSQVAQVLQKPDLPLILVGTYVVLCLPFTFRSIDAGLRTVPLRAIVEASSSLGAGTWRTLAKVVMPNIYGPMLFSVFFAVALRTGEFAVAATLNQELLSVWLFAVSSTNFRASIAVSVLMNLATWSILLAASVLANRFSPEHASAKEAARSDAKS